MQTNSDSDCVKFFVSQEVFFDLTGWREITELWLVE